MRVVFTAASRAELQAIGDYIAYDNPKRAVTFVNELEKHCEALATRPHMHPLLSGRERSGIRKAVHGHYLIFYRIGAEVVEILHVLHGARDWEWIVSGDQDA
jgi:addiction module RelE/StbE family toxin